MAHPDLVFLFLPLVMGDESTLELGIQDLHYVPTLLLLVNLLGRFPELVELTCTQWPGFPKVRFLPYQNCLLEKFLFGVLYVLNLNLAQVLKDRQQHSSGSAGARE